MTADAFPQLTDEQKAMQVDPLHAASVLAHIFSAIGAPDTSAETGLPSTAPAGTATASADTAAAPTPTAQTAGTSGAETFPIEGGAANAPINQGFGGAGGHPGIDFGVPAGSHAVAAIDGTVTVAGNTDPGGYGNEVEITGPNGLAVRYGHLSGINVKVGQTVHAGQSVGETGGIRGAPGAGNSTGPHLHFEVDQNGKPIDPAPLLAGGAAIVGMPDSANPTADPTPISPDKILSAQLTNVTDTIAGRTPTLDVSAQTQQPTTTPAGNAATAGQGAGATSGSWATDILEGIGAPVTPQNLALLDQWMAAEGGANHLNPLNTTLDKPGATNWNDLGNGVHVKTYTSYEQGLTATIETLLQSNMAGIVAALRSGNVNAARAAIVSSPWGTKNL